MKRQHYILCFLLFVLVFQVFVVTHHKYFSPVLNHILASLTASAQSAETTAISGDWEIPVNQDPMKILQDSEVYGRQGVQMGPNVRCFKYTSDKERNEWRKPDKFMSCFLANACYNAQQKTVFVPDFKYSADKLEVFGISGISIKKGSYADVS